MASLGRRTMWLWVWLALIVQIVAPVLAGTSMVAAAADPLADAWICSHDAASPSSDTGTAGLGADACRLCDLVCKGGGLAPPVAAVAVPETVFVVLAVTWTDTAADLVGARVPTAEQARAPPRAA